MVEHFWNAEDKGSKVGHKKIVRKILLAKHLHLDELQDRNSYHTRMQADHDGILPSTRERSRMSKYLRTTFQSFPYLVSILMGLSLGVVALVLHPFALLV